MLGQLRLGTLIEIAMVLACAWLIYTALSIAPDPRGHGTHEQLGLEPCGYLKRTGQPCPSCGMTTSFAHMVRLQVVPALGANPAGAILCAVAMILPFYLLHARLLGLPPERIVRPPRGAYFIVGMALILMLSWFYKIRVMAP
jgi:uncharacterized protein DUF2752